MQIGRVVVRFDAPGREYFQKFKKPEMENYNFDQLRKVEQIQLKVLAILGEAAQNKSFQVFAYSFVLKYLTKLK